MTSNRDHFGDQLPQLCLKVVNEIESADNDDNSKETKHRMELIDTLCQLICHLSIVANEDDLFDMETQLAKDNLDNLR